MPGRGIPSSINYSYGFNGKENDPEVVGTGEGTQDYGMRIYNPSLGKFLSVDPLTKSYPELTPYQFAANRPIDGIDLDGAEWEQKTDKDGKTNITVTVDFDNSEGALPDDKVCDYQEATIAQFQSTLEKSSEGKITGTIVFLPHDPNYNGVRDGKLFPQLKVGSEGIRPDGLIEGARTYWQKTWVNSQNKQGGLVSPEQFALDAVHDMFHGIRLDHPFENTQSPDTKLINKGWDNYITTKTTDKDILYNIMMYPFQSINSNCLGELWKVRKGDLLTKGQLEFIKKEIDLQMKGYGVGKLWAQYWNHMYFPGKQVPLTK